MTSGNTKLIDLAPLVSVFLYLNSMKPQQDPWGMMLREQSNSGSSLRVTERLKTSARGFNFVSTKVQILFNNLYGQGTL